MTGSKTSKWIHKYLTDEQILEISKAVAEAETKTSGEIVPIIVKRSSAIGHVQSLVFLCLALVQVMLDLSLGHLLQPENLWIALGFGTVLSWLIAKWLSRVSFIQKIFTSASDQKLQVWQRAELEFSRNRLVKTANRTGILIFVSVMERQAVILADEGIAKFHSKEVWYDLVKELSHRLKDGEWFKGFDNSIKQAGKILTEKLPAQRHERNELANNLRILE